jgi:hypothetical protein
VAVVFNALERWEGGGQNGGEMTFRGSLLIEIWTIEKCVKILVFFL